MQRLSSRRAMTLTDKAIVSKYTTLIARNYTKLKHEV